MRKRDAINIILFILSFAFIFIYKNILIVKYLRYADIMASLFLIIISFIAFLTLGYRVAKEDKKKKKITGLVIYEIVVYFFVIYGIGIIIGFQRNVYSLKLTSILFNIITPLTMIIFGELFRNIMIQANKDRKIVIILITLLLSLFEVIVVINSYELNTIEGLFKLLSCEILPILFKQSVLSYLTYYTGIKNSVLYQLIIKLYVFIVPVVPYLGNYLTCVSELILPVAIYLAASKIITQRDYVEPDINNKKVCISDVIFTVIFIVIISVVSGVFNIKLVSIASNSMTPCFNRGDAVLIEKYSTKKEYKVGDIISFNNNGRTTVHRITEVVIQDGNTYFHTKGDANNTDDSLLVPVNNVYGKVLFRIPYIGYPSVLISEYRSGRSGN